MIVLTDYLWFNTKKRQEFIRITDEVAAIVSKSGVKEGMVLVSAMHITAGVYVNDWEDGLIDDFQVWLEKLAPAGLRLPASSDRRGQRRRAPEAHDHGPSGDRCRSPTASSISVRGSRCSTRSSTASGRSGSSSR